MKSTSKIVKKNTEPPSVAKLLLAAAAAYVLLHSLTLIDASPPQFTEKLAKNKNAAELFVPVIPYMLKSIIITFAFFMQFIVTGILLAAAFCQMGRETWTWMKHMFKRRL